MEENTEINDLVIKKKKYSYIVLIIVFIASVVCSNIYFNSLKKNNNIQEIESGEVSGEMLATIESGESNSGEGIEKADNQVEENNEQQTAEILETKIEEKVDTKEQEKNNSATSKRVIDPDKPMVALTFDDGPDPKRTQKMIEVLQKYGAVATFFDIGNLMEKYPDVVKAELAAGCDVGGHTYSHVNLNAISQEEAKKEVQNVEKAFYNATGEKLKYLRPTYGNANANVRAVTDIPIINWCVDARDWESRNADKVIETIMETKNFDGKIILMHVIYDSTIEAVDRLIPMLQEKGYQIVTISEMVEAKGKTLENGKIYYQF